MFHFLFILLLIIIIVPLLFVFGVALKFWNMLTGGNNNYKSNGFGRGSYGNSANQNRNTNRENTSNNSRQSSSNYGGKKFFKEGEGEYVDFEEVDD